MTVEQYWKEREAQARDQLAQVRHTQDDCVPPAAWQALSAKLSRELTAVHRKAVRSAVWRVLVQFKCGARSIQGALWFAQDMIERGKLRLMTYAGPTGRPEFPNEMWMLPPISPDEEGNEWQTYQVRYFAANGEQARLGEPVLFAEHGRDELSSIYFKADGTVAKRRMRKAYALKLANGWHVLDDVYFNAVNRQLPTLKPLLDEFRTLAARERRHIDKQNQIRKCEAEIKELSRLKNTWNAVQLPDEQMVEILGQAELFRIGDPAKPGGLILKGVPGTGKTFLARTLAQALRCKFLEVKLADVKKPNIGQGVQEIAQMWKDARQNGPTIMFIDECERVFGKRGSAEVDTIASDIVQAFLGEWDGNEKNVWVIAATNRPDMIDEAIVSRFGWSMEIRLPSLDARKRIFRAELAKVGFTGQVPQKVDHLTQGLSGRDLGKLAKRVRAIAHPRVPEAADFIAAIKAHRGDGNTSVDKEARWDNLILDKDTLDNLKAVCAVLGDIEGWRQQGVTIPKGMLLVGPPGVGKTQIARTLANEAGLSFIAATTADVKGTVIGESSRLVQALFDRARASAPAILFLDELDIIAPCRDLMHTDVLVKEIIGQLLQEMDGIRRQASQVFVLGATNHPERTDSAILSRMTTKITIPMPNEESRRRLLAIMLGGARLSFALDSGCAILAKQSVGMSGRDLGNWISKAQTIGVMRAMGEGGAKQYQLRLEDFEAARCTSASQVPPCSPCP